MFSAVQCPLSSSRVHPILGPISFWQCARALLCGNRIAHARAHTIDRRALLTHTKAAASRSCNARSHSTAATQWTLCAHGAQRVITPEFVSDTFFQMCVCASCARASIVRVGPTGGTAKVICSRSFALLLFASARAVCVVVVCAQKKGPR